MALNQDDILLGEKTHYYCSSSEEEAEESDEGSSDETPAAQAPEVEAPPVDLRTYGGTCVNTGPKGVLQDYRRFKQLETEQREENRRERDELAKRLAFTCKTSDEDDADRELEELLNGAEDVFLEHYREQRMKELQQAVHHNSPTFGKVITLNKENFIDAIDKENAAVTIIVHLYEERVPACESLSGCLQCLATSFPKVKFCELRSSEAKMSAKFRSSGVPALLAYKNGELVSSHVRLVDQLGEDFFANELEAFLIEHGLLHNASEIPTSIRSQQDEDDTSDFELD